MHSPHPIFAHPDVSPLTAIRAFRCTPPQSVVGPEEFDVAVLRAVAGIEKKRSILAGQEKEVVARHEVSGRFKV